MGYEIEFENDPNLGATAAAQEVVVTDPNPAGASTMLDADLDLTTLQFTSFGFGPFRFDVPAGLSNYETTIDLRPDGIALLVPVKLELNQATRVLKATFRSLDPLTGLPPDDPDAGFLPVNNANHDGEGFFTYIVQPVAGRPTSTEITNQASIVFDTNSPILTPTTRHTLDVGAPTSTVTTLPAQVASSFPVSWSGTDDAGGSRIASFDVFVSDNGGPFQIWKTGTIALTDSFMGEDGHTYGFYSVATDNVGLVQTPPAAAQATTMVVSPPTIEKVALVRDAAGKKVISIMFDFSEQMLRAGAENLANYQILTVSSRPKPARLLSALYDDESQSVTLQPQKSISLKKLPKLTVSALGSINLTDLNDQLLDGDKNGSSGGDFSALMSAVPFQAVTRALPVAAVDSLLERNALCSTAAQDCVEDDPFFERKDRSILRGHMGKNH